MGKVTQDDSLMWGKGTRIISQKVPPEFLERKLKEQAAGEQTTQPKAELNPEQTEEPEVDLNQSAGEHARRAFKWYHANPGKTPPTTLD